MVLSRTGKSPVLSIFDTIGQKQNKLNGSDNECSYSNQGNFTQNFDLTEERNNKRREENLSVT